MSSCTDAMYKTKFDNLPSAFMEPSKLTLLIISQLPQKLSGIFKLL